MVAAREKVGFDDLTIHDLRHVAASAWIAQDLDVAYVSALLGHANPSITLGAYAHLFDATKHADRAREAMDNAFGDVLDASDEERGQVARLTPAS